MPLKGNGWYVDGVVEKALKYELITKEDIKYYIKPPHILKQNHFYNFVSEICDIFGCDAKNDIHGFIWSLGNKLYVKKEIILKVIAMLWLTKLLITKTDLFRWEVFTKLKINLEMLIHYMPTIMNYIKTINPNKRRRTYTLQRY